MSKSHSAESMEELQATAANGAAAPAIAAADAACPSPRDEVAMGDEDFTPSAGPRPSIFARASSFASRATRVIALPRTKSTENQPIEETESEDGVQSESERDASLSNASETIVPLMLPWQTRAENGDVVDDSEIRHKILEVTVFRSTYTETPNGRDGFIFDYAKYSGVAKELLFSDPSLREMHSLLVPSVVNELTFWRNYFLRCNAVRLELQRPPYLEETTVSTIAAVASIQKLKRQLSLRTGRMRRTLSLRSRSTVDQLDVELGDLDLDLDGEIDRELRKRRPSRIVPPRA